MDRFTFFESGAALIGVRLGIISVAHLVKYDIYKTYLTLCQKNTIKEARKLIMIRYACDKVTVSRAISFFEADKKLPLHSFATNGHA